MFPNFLLRCQSLRLALVIGLVLFLNTRTTLRAQWPFTESIRGSVFLDYDANGQDAGPEEPGVAGILVQAYGGDNLPLDDPQVTDAEGSYRIDGLAPGQRVRLQFIISRELHWLRPGAAGSGSTTTVAFASAGDANVNLGLTSPTEYCQRNPSTIVSCFVSADAGEGRDQHDVLLSIPYTATGFSRDQTSSLATQAHIGAVYGLAYQRSTQTVYAAAYMKRFAAFGPGGPDAIYRLALDGTRLDALNLSELAGRAHVAGLDPHDLRRTAAVPHSQDWESYAQIGKMSLGDIEISDDQATLFVLNLFDRAVYAISIAQTQDPALSDRWEVPDECNGSEHRPMGLAWHNERLWIGAACEDGTTAFVHSLDPNHASFALETKIDLRYPRPKILNLPNSTGVSAAWQPWSNDPTQFSYTVENGDSSEIVHPQPVLSDIEFDGPHMILGFRDRFGDQTGYRAPQVPPELGSEQKPAGRLYSGNAVGDILRVCRLEEGWIVEGQSQNSCHRETDESVTKTLAENDWWPYYQWDFYPKSGADGWSPRENAEQSETVQGGLLQLHGRTSILATALNPFSAFSGGYLRLENRTGRRVGVGPDEFATELAELAPGGYLIYSASQNANTFGHANGLGDVEALCEEAPIEIGNRVWLDHDEDGVQDPDEPGIEAVDVALFEGQEQIGVAQTNALGEYIFGGIDGANLISVAQLQPNRRYQLRVALVDAALQGGGFPTIPDYVDDREQSDLHDSDGDWGDAHPGTATISFRTGDPGDNNHTYDFGFVPVKYDLALTHDLAHEESGTVDLDQEVRLTIRVRNEGNVESGVFKVTQHIPAGLSFVSADGTGWVIAVEVDASGPSTFRFLGNLPPGEETELEVVLKVVDLTHDPFRSWSEISSDSSEAYATNDLDSTPDFDTGMDDGAGLGTPPNDRVSKSHILPRDPRRDEDDNDFVELSVRK